MGVKKGREQREARILDQVTRLAPFGQSKLHASMALVCVTGCVGVCVCVVSVAHM